MCAEAILRARKMGSFITLVGTRDWDKPGQEIVGKREEEGDCYPHESVIKGEGKLRKLPIF